MLVSAEVFEASLVAAQSSVIQICNINVVAGLEELMDEVAADEAQPPVTTMRFKVPDFLLVTCLQVELAVLAQCEFQCFRRFVVVTGDTGALSDDAACNPVRNVYDTIIHDN